MTDSGIEILVRFFAAAREAADRDEMRLEVAAGSRVRDLLARIREEMPAMEAVLARSRVAVNQMVVGAEVSLADGDELAILPPVGGG